jgi:hypothetical protein
MIYVYISLDLVGSLIEAHNMGAYRRGTVGTSRYLSRNGLAAAVIGVAMLAGTAACGGGGSGSAGPLAGLTGDQIANKAIAGLKAASSVHFAGTIAESGATYIVNMNAGTTKCTGTLGIQGKGSFALLKTGQTIWIKPDNLFWTSNGATSAVLAVVGGKWIQSTTSDSNLTSVSQLCSPAQIADSFGSKLNEVVKGATTTVDGQSALLLKDTKDSSSAYVTVSAAPEFVRLNGGSSGHLDFSDYNAPVNVSAPPPSQTLQGSKIGF